MSHTHSTDLVPSAPPVGSNVSQPISESRNLGPSTKSVHAGRRTNPYHAIAEPLVQTATYTFENTQDLRSFMEYRIWGPVEGRVDYGRYGNPSVRAVESRLAALEGAGDALMFATGMAAITTTLLSLLSDGDHVVMTDDCYRRTRLFCQTYLKRLGVECSTVPMGDYAALEEAIRPETKLFVSESPTNPYLRILDLERFAEIARKNGVKTIIDSTFATPLNLRPLDWGVDLVIHSATKYLAGHNDLLAGILAGSIDLLAPVREALGTLGAVADPHNAFLLDRGLKTLGLRVERQNQNGLAISQFLESHPAIEQVWYPGLPSHPDHKIAVAQMHGFGGVISFTLHGDLETTSGFIDALRIPKIATSLGGTESLISQPAIMSYFDMEPEERRSLGILDNLVRLAVGIEDSEDLIADLDQALQTI
ncbi:MAG: aminotransferase class I/II-fold pyridoxal phosphate-dependent enzyme [Anaerolineales bacterium]